MDIGDMDIEDFQHAWRRARISWDQARQRKLEAEASGRRLSGQELAGWLAARARFAEYEQVWDQLYRAGVVVVTGDDDDEQDDPGPAVPPTAILYSLPTICDVLPATAGGLEIDRLQLHEDDWRQVEVVSGTLLDVVADELRAIFGVYEAHARRSASGGLTGFGAIHARSRPDRPLPAPLPRRRLQGMLPTADHHYGGVGFAGSPGIVAGSFAAAYGPAGLYGISDGDHVTVLGLRLEPGASPPPALVTALRQAMDAFSVVIVDWCRCSVIDARSLASYLASLPSGAALKPSGPSGAICTSTGTSTAAPHGTPKQSQGRRRPSRFYWETTAGTFV